MINTFDKNVQSSYYAFRRLIIFGALLLCSYSDYIFILRVQCHEGMNDVQCNEGMSECQCHEGMTRRSVPRGDERRSMPRGDERILSASGG